MREIDIQSALGGFQFEGRFRSFEEVRSGHINHTFRLTFENPGRGYILQRINTNVFKDPRLVMENIRKVTGHLRDGLIRSGVSPRRRVLEFIPALDGSLLFEDESGQCFRAYHFVGNARAYDRVEKPEHFREAGRAFGEFQSLLSDFEVSELGETIPDFHNTPKRFRHFEAAVEEDKVGRLKSARAEAAFFLDRRGVTGEIVGRIESGAFPLRVTHNDTKINNVLIDEDTGKAICVIDLDTVMPGSVLYDYGDAIRFGASTAAEDEPDASKIALDMELFRQFTRGFLSETNGFLTEAEIRLLPLGIKVITCELAMRFLTDYIDGDLYFKIKSPDHNLIRARAQMALLVDVEKKFDSLQQYVNDLVATG